MERRLEIWREMVSEALEELTAKVDGLTFEALSLNDGFTATFAEATLIAARTHQKEKLFLLRNVVLNTALPNPPNDDVQVLFLSMLEEFTTWHIRLLQFFSSPNWPDEVNLPRNRALALQQQMPESLTTIFPEVENQIAFFTKVINDLSQNRLLKFPDIRPDQRGVLIGTDEPEDGDYLTELGHQLLGMVANPLES